jgi:uncharacterized glyoxalase superfamily protein PhnB
MNTTTASTPTTIQSIGLEVDDVVAARRFYSELGLPDQLHIRQGSGRSSGFRGFTLSLLGSQPSAVDRVVAAAVDSGATAIKPVAKSFWGYGGVFRAPDGTIWKVATSNKKDTDPAGGRIDELVILLGVSDMLASKDFYVRHGMVVAKSFGRKYVEFTSDAGSVKMGLYGRRALAKDAGVAPDGDGSHRLVITSAAGPFTDPDGFVWHGPVIDAN